MTLYFIAMAKASSTSELELVRKQFYNFLAQKEMLLFPEIRPWVMALMPLEAKTGCRHSH
jgi:hypothetical protein